MSESTETANAPASGPSAPQPSGGRRTEGRTISYPRAMLVGAIVFAASAAAGLVGSFALAAGLAALVALVFLGWAAWRGVLRAPTMVMAEVTWLVLATVLELAFLEKLPAAPLPVFAGILLVQYALQLLADLRRFASAGTSTPPVTYSVTFALAPALAVAAELFREARANYPTAAGVALAMLIAASVFLLLVLWWDWTRRAFSSLKMAVTLISLIGLGSIVGTFVIQHQPDDRSAETFYEKFMNGEGAAPVNARYLFGDPQVEWSDADEERRVAMNAKFGAGEGDRWSKMELHDRVKQAKTVEGTLFVRENRHGLHAFYDFCERTQFTRIFKSWYYNALLVLLAGTVVGVMIRRFPYELKDAGWVTAHAGIVFLLLCFAGSDVSVRDGFATLRPTAAAGRPPGAFPLPTEIDGFPDAQVRDRAGDPVVRSFGDWWLRLIRTSADWYQELKVAFVDADGKFVAQKHYPVLAGKVLELERPAKDAPPRYRIEMLEFVERADTSSSFRAAGHPTGQTALQLVLDGSSVDQWLVTGTEGDLAMPMPGGRVRLVVAKDAAAAERFASPQIAADAGAVGIVRVTDRTGAEVVKLPATAGAEADFESAGKKWHVKVLDVAFDAATWAAEKRAGAVHAPVERQIPGQAVAFLALTPDGGEPQRSVAIDMERVEHPPDGPLADAGLETHVETVTPTELRLVLLPDGSLQAIRETRGTVEKPAALHEGDVLPLPGLDDGPRVRIGKLLREAEMTAEVKPLPPETDADYLRNGLQGRNEQVGRPALRVRVTGDGSEPYEQWIVGGDPWTDVQFQRARDGRFVMQLMSTSESMYRSAVQAIDRNGRVLAEHVVRVNDPFRMAGYEFYQNTFVPPDRAEAGGPNSTFRVKFDPFVPWIYVGFVLVAGGVITLLWFPGQRAFKLHAHLANLPQERIEPARAGEELA